MNKEPLVCICGSAGSIQYLKIIIEHLPKTIPFPLVIIIHRQERFNSELSKILQNDTTIQISSPEDGEPIESNHIYIAPPGYHLQIEPNFVFSFSVDEPQHFSRPAIDVLLETAVRAYEENIHCFILSGSSVDGAKGATCIEQAGGKVYVINPEATSYKTMPEAAIEATKSPVIVQIDQMSKILNLIGVEIYEEG